MIGVGGRRGTSRAERKYFFPSSIVWSRPDLRHTHTHTHTRMDKRHARDSHPCAPAFASEHVQCCTGESGHGLSRTHWFNVCIDRFMFPNCPNLYEYDADCEF